MDPNEIMRLLRIIHGNGHQAMYLPRTRDELNRMGIAGYAETALGPLEVVPFEKPDEKTVLICTVISAGETLTLPDNLTGPCAWGCGRTIQHRPWAPLELPRVCLYCMADRKKDDQ